MRVGFPGLDLWTAPAPATGGSSHARAAGPSIRRGRASRVALGRAGGRYAGQGPQLEPLGFSTVADLLRRYNYRTGRDDGPGPRR